MTVLKSLIDEPMEAKLGSDVLTSGGIHHSTLPTMPMDFPSYSYCMSFNDRGFIYK